MKPILFNENSTTFTTNGIGRLSDAISCSVTEKRNGMYELEMVYPMTGAHYSEIGIRNIVVVKPSANATLQAFRIYKITRPINGKVTVYAQHISYDLSKNTTMPFSVTASTSACATTLSQLKSQAVESCPFTFWTDVTTAASYKQTIPASIRSRLGGVEGSVLDQFGGEYEWDNYTVKLHKNRGTKRDITLRYGKNITDIEQEENIAGTVTGIVPYWTNVDGTETIVLPEKAVYSSNVSKYSSRLTIPIDFSQEWENAPAVESLRTAANVYVNQSGFGIPKVSIDVSFVNLADTEEYKDILPLQNVNLCDEITVQFEALGIDTTAEIVETVYDVLKERYISLQVGSLRSTLAAVVNDIEANAVQSISDTGKRVFAEANTQAQDLVNNATAWITSANGYVIAVKGNDGEWKELIFADNQYPENWHNLLRINEHGIGFSSDGGRTYQQAWTLDGRLVIGGTNVPSISVIDDNNNILFHASKDGVTVNKGIITLKDGNNNTVFQASSSGVNVNAGTITLKNGDTIVFQASSVGMVWNAINSSMSAEGVLRAVGATLTNATITGSLEVKNGDAVLFKAHPTDGVMWNATNSSMDSTGKITARNAVINGKITNIGKDYVSGKSYETQTVIDDGRILMYADGGDYGISIRAYKVDANTRRGHIKTSYNLWIDSNGSIEISSDNGGNINIIADGEINLQGTKVNINETG